LYIDFELSHKQLENRYSEDYKNHYRWSDNFIRVEVKRSPEYPEEMKYNDVIKQSLESTIIETGAKIVIVDNLTCINDGTEKAKDASSFMKFLDSLRAKHDLSLLVLTHTPKRDASRPITINDMSGSAMLGNFIDAAFTIGASVTDSGIRYIKQIKQRTGEKVFDADNVLVCELTKLTNFLRFEFLSYGKESEHLRSRTEGEQEENEGAVIALHGEGRSFREIGRELNISHMKAKRIIDKCNELLHL
jgi:hypothetical protein